MYAESVARGGEGGSESQAVTYIQDLRKRAKTGYSQVDAAWLKASASINGSTANVNFGNILNERCRELYWEATRRSVTDCLPRILIRGQKKEELSPE